MLIRSPVSFDSDFAFQYAIYLSTTTTMDMTELRLADAMPFYLERDFIQHRIIYYLKQTSTTTKICNSKKNATVFATENKSW